MKRLEAIPAWLRWALFLPVGLALHFIFAAAVEATFGAAGLRAGRGTPNAMAVGAVLAFLSGVTFTLLPSILSPKPRVVALVLFACGVLIDAVPIGYSYVNHEYQRSRLPLVAAMAATEALGGVLAVLLAVLLAGRRSPPAVSS